MKDEMMKAFHFRHACKIFDEARNIPQEDLRFILEAGRLSPSSFGLEQWKFIVVQSKEVKEKLRAVCYGQVQLTTCSDAVVIVGKIGDSLAPGSGYVTRLFQRYGFPVEQYQWLTGFYETIYKELDIPQWSITQCHIAAANMMTAAAALCIDSCPIGGMEPDKVLDILGYDPKHYVAALIIPFGYRKNPQPEKIRLPFDEVVEFR